MEVEVEAELVNLKDQLQAAQPNSKEIHRVAPTAMEETEDDLVNWHIDKYISNISTWISII